MKYEYIGIYKYYEKVRRIRCINFGLFDKIFGWEDWFYVGIF